MAALGELEWEDLALETQDFQGFLPFAPNLPVPRHLASLRVQQTYGFGGQVNDRINTLVHQLCVGCEGHHSVGMW